MRTSLDEGRTAVHIYRVTDKPLGHNLNLLPWIAINVQHKCTQQVTYLHRLQSLRDLIYYKHIYRARGEGVAQNSN